MPHRRAWADKTLQGVNSWIHRNKKEKKKTEHQSCRCIQQNELVVRLMTDSNKVYKQLYSVVRGSLDICFQQWVNNGAPS